MGRKEPGSRRCRPLHLVPRSCTSCPARERRKAQACPCSGRRWLGSRGRRRRSRRAACLQTPVHGRAGVPTHQADRHVPTLRPVLTADPRGHPGWQQQHPPTHAPLPAVRPPPHPVNCREVPFPGFVCEQLRRERVRQPKKVHHAHPVSRGAAGPPAAAGPGCRRRRSSFWRRRRRLGLLVLLDASP